MTATLLDFSQKAELALHARVVADVQAVAAAMDVPIMITGAFARDLHIHYAHGIDTIRRTEDLDFALAVPDWPSFTNLKQQLLETGEFSEVPRAPQRLHHANDLPVDLVPFGGVESASREIHWPPGGELTMDVFGFKEVLAAAQQVRLPSGVETAVVSLPALALLKIVAWQERHYRAPRKDAHDLMLIITNYLDCGHQERLWTEFRAWTEEDDFDVTGAGARMLGVDIAALLDDAGRQRIIAIIAEQTDKEALGLLPQEMSARDADRARALLECVLEGFSES